MAVGHSRKYCIFFIKGSLRVTTNVLFLTHPYPNYVPDLLLHGLRKILGPEVVDYPRKDCLYDGVLGLGVCPEDQLCPNWFPPDEGLVDREDIAEKINHGYFEYIVCDLRAIPLLNKIRPEWPSGLAIVDGEDVPIQELKPGPYLICRRETDGSDSSLPLPMSLPEEVFNLIRSYDDVEKVFSVGFLGSTMRLTLERKEFVEQIAQLYPDSLLKTSDVAIDTNPSPDARLGRNDYYMNLQKCRIVISLAGVGYDTFRFWENTACNALHLSQRIPLSIPNDFEDNTHILRFSNIDEARNCIDSVLNNGFKTDEVVQENRRHLINFHLTSKRALYLLDALRRVFQ